MSAADDSRRIADMTAWLRTFMQARYPPKDTKRGAHPHTIGLVRGVLTVGPTLPDDLRVGMFATAGRSFDCWVRFSSSNPVVLADGVPDARGCAIQLLSPADGITPLGQDFVLISNETLALGDVARFHEAIFFAVKLGIPPLYLAKLVATGRWRMIAQLVTTPRVPRSVLDMAYYSVTPFAFGKPSSSAAAGNATSNNHKPGHDDERVPAVKYKLVPTSNARAHPNRLEPRGAAHYLTHRMSDHLAKHEATFDLCVQLRTDPSTMPIEDCSVKWSEQASPYRKVATLRIAPQALFDSAMAEAIAFNPARTFPEHGPLGGLNRARAEVYAALAKFRMERRSGIALSGGGSGPGAEAAAAAVVETKSKDEKGDAVAAPPHSSL